MKSHLILLVKERFFLIFTIPLLALSTSLQYMDISDCSLLKTISFLIFIFCMLLLPVFALFTLIFIIKALRRKPDRDKFLASAILSFSSIMLTLGSFRAGGWIHHIALERATRNGSIIIDSLDVYFNKNKAYPKTLGSLVPDFLGKIPNTGICGTPDFRYNSEDSGLDYSLSIVETYEDRLEYSPRRVVTNEQTSYSSVEKIGKWGYYQD